MLLGIDSTDSVEGGCTTHVAAEVWRALARFGVRGGPRLVRLNPNVPYKTRGNGALCLELGHGRGRRRLAGVVRGRELWAYEEIEEPSSSEQLEIFHLAREVIDERRSAASNTGLIATSLVPDASWYRRAVEGHVDAAPNDFAMSSHRWGNGRGLIGAVAAAAWPARLGTYELIAYRETRRWGTKRALPLSLGAELDSSVAGSFDNWDPEFRHLRVAPASPCPILIGVRGTRPDALPNALPLLDVEPVNSWMLFVTNQASGDHLRATSLSDVRSFDSALIRVRVTTDPYTRPGGHVFVSVGDGEATDAVVAAYEPTKSLRDHVRSLQEGDEVLVEAAAHDDPRILALEALEIVGTVPRAEELSTCACGGAMPSRGRRAARVCAKCGRLSPATLANRPLPAPGRVTAPVCVRRHLATPPGFASERLVLPPGGIAA